MLLRFRTLITLSSVLKIGIDCHQFRCSGVSSFWLSRATWCLGTLASVLRANIYAPRPRCCSTRQHCPPYPLRFGWLWMNSRDRTIAEAQAVPFGLYTENIEVGGRDVIRALLTPPTSYSWGGPMLMEIAGRYVLWRSYDLPYLIATDKHD